MNKVVLISLQGSWLDKEIISHVGGPHVVVLVHMHHSTIITHPTD